MVISNTSPLVYLHQVERIELLRDLYRKVTVPPAVETELRRGAAIGYPTPDLSTLPWVRVHPLTDRSLLPVIADLGSGESEAIALGLANPGCLVLLDDALGRKIAGRRGLAFTGTLGVLVKSKKIGLLSRIAPVIDNLRRTTMYLSPELITAVLQEAGELPI